MTLKLNGTNSVAAPAYAGDDADTGLQCGTNELKLVTGGSARATVDSSGNLGVGTESPDKLFHVESSSFSRTKVSTTAASAFGQMYFGDENKYVIGYRESHSSQANELSLKNIDSNGLLTFHTGASERLRITSDGTLQLRNSPGIDFSQLQTNASGMSSETLDSYEEGTWTPSTSNFTHTTNTSRYTKIGRKVHIFGSLSRNQATAPTTATLILTGLPFNRSTNQISFDGTFWLDNGGPSSGDNVGGVTYIYTTTDIIFAAATSPGQQATHRYVRGVDLNNTRGIQFSCTYYTD